jgi:hypothetical protein
MCAIGHQRLCKEPVAIVTAKCTDDLHLREDSGLSCSHTPLSGSRKWANLTHVQSLSVHYHAVYSNFQLESALHFHFHSPFVFISVLCP